MKVGLHYPDFGYPNWETTLEDRLVETARIADEGGFDLFTVMDHWFQMEPLGGPVQPMLEGYTTLGYLAAVTRQVRLGLLVTGATYRHPGLLAKTVTTLDRLSRGRAVLGIGAAWYEREHLGLGVPYPSMSERFERLEETLQVCRQMWSADDGPYDGKYFHLHETVNVPPPYQASGPRILIGGSGERKTLRLVAQYGDACNLLSDTPEILGRKIRVLQDHCEAVGRDPSEIEVTAIGSGISTGPEPRRQLLERLTGYAEVGVSLVTVIPTGDDPRRWAEDFVDNMLPELKNLTPSR